MYLRGSLGFLELTDEERVCSSPVLPALVRTHPVTSRKSLYLASHAGKVQGMRAIRNGRALCKKKNVLLGTQHSARSGMPQQPGIGSNFNPRMVCPDQNERE